MRKKQLELSYKAPPFDDWLGPFTTPEVVDRVVKHLKAGRIVRVTVDLSGKVTNDPKDIRSGMQLVDGHIPSLQAEWTDKLHPHFPHVDFGSHVPFGLWEVVSQDRHVLALTFGPTFDPM